VSRAPAIVRWSAWSRDARATAAIGETMGRPAPDSALLRLEGPLGAGKTTFAQGVGAGCGVQEPVTSPTYNLILRYSGERSFTHVDLYRLGDASELETLDLDAILGGSGVTCVEWPEILGSRHDPPWARVRIEPESGHAGPRRIRCELAGEGWEPAFSALAGHAEPADG
jgi:tRNA threonylcarbamoyladenosine biosynthesis protein TsaE